MEMDPRAEYNQDLYRRWRDARADWDSEARKDVDFYLGNHFTSSESDELKSRNQADVPMDRISPAVEKLKATLTSRPPTFTITPREDSDVQISSIWRTILGFVWDISTGDAQMKQAIHDYAISGLGYLYVYIDTEADFGRGDVKFTNVNPFRVYVPPSSRDRWFADAESIILSTILTGEQVVALYPELGIDEDPDTGEEIKPLIDSLSAYREEDYPTARNKNSMQVFTPSETQHLDQFEFSKYQILERYYKTKVPFYRVLDTSTGQEYIFNDADIQRYMEESSDLIENGVVQIVEVPQNRVKVCATIGEIVLYESVLNTDVYPIVPLPNVWTESPYPKSDVSRARPMQRLLNKVWSLAISHAQASAGLKLLVPLGSVEDLNQLEKDWANPNAVIEVDSSQGEPHFPAPQPLAGEFYKLIQQCEFYIDFIFGLPEMMHGFAEKAPETVRGTERMMALGQERPKSKLRDIEFSINKLGKVLYNYAKGHYTFQKMFRIAQPNNNLKEATVNLYDDKTEPILDIAKDRYKLDQHDIRIEPGSTLPTSKWAELGVYLEAYQLGIVDRIEVLKKNPEIFDKEGILSRMDEKQQLVQQVQGLQGQVKDLQGDLQTARRESVSDRKRVEVEKLKTRLSEIASDAKADRRVESNKMQNKVKLEAERLRREADRLGQALKA
jgi:regulator of replication initiation timing